ncbi:MAG: DUF368 domain-containing protein [Candidatus Woesearchaeota archaeon]
MAKKTKKEKVTVKKTTAKKKKAHTQKKEKSVEIKNNSKQVVYVQTKKQSKSNHTKSTTIFLKGMLMGASDIVPGISGGTIALITGIYERLITAISEYTPKNALTILETLGSNKQDAQKRSDTLKKLDVPFIATLAGGIILAIILGSYIIKYMLENHTANTLLFFVGIILSALIGMYQRIKTHTSSARILGILGILAGASLMFIIPVSNAVPALWYIFLGGFIGVSAMFIPGISGSFILLILGLYEYLIDALHAPAQHIFVILTFLIGAKFGALSIAKVMKYVLKKYHTKTMYVLIGIVTGTLIMPISRAYENMHWDLFSTLWAIVALLLGFGISTLIQKLSQKEVPYESSS